MVFELAPGWQVACNGHRAVAAQQLTHLPLSALLCVCRYLCLQMSLPRADTLQGNL